MPQGGGGRRGRFWATAWDSGSVEAERFRSASRKEFLDDDESLLVDEFAESSNEPRMSLRLKHQDRIADWGRRRSG